MKRSGNTFSRSIKSTKYVRRADEIADRLLQMEPSVSVNSHIMNPGHIEEVLKRRAAVLTLENNLKYFAYIYPRKMKEIQVGRGYARNGVKSST